MLSITTKRLIRTAFIATLIPLVAMAPLRRDAGGNRAILDNLETKPFNPDWTASLTNWTHEGVLDPTNIQGKVVILTVLSSGHPHSYMTVSRLTRLHRDHQEDGLIVAAVHPEFGYDSFYKKIEAGRVTIPVALDQGDVFAKAMNTDDYPDLYLIDRAGNLRFVDLDERALPDAVELLLSETTETAASNNQLQSQGLDPVTAKKTPPPMVAAANDSGSDMSASEETAETDSTPAVPEVANPTITFNTDSPDKYTSVRWPSKNTSLKSIDHQGQPLPVEFGTEAWITPGQNIESQVVIVSFWAVWASKSTKAFTILDEIMTEHEGKVAAIAMAGVDEPWRSERYIERHPTQIHHLVDEERKLYNALKVRSMPQVVVLSTDGTIRWQGDPHAPRFKEIVQSIVENDPGL